MFKEISFRISIAQIYAFPKIARHIQRIKYVRKKI